MSTPHASDRDAALRRLRSLSTGIVVASAAAVGVISVGVAAAAPGRSATTHRTSPSVPSTSTGSGQDNSALQPPDQAPQNIQPAPDPNPPAVTSGGS
jgi:hypothetical protein